jgi:hypothetical protein
MVKSKLKCSVGNLKVGKDTIILNITSATDCESLKRGLCQVPYGKCYALRAEKQYPDVLPYRRAQTRVWDSLTPEEIAADVKKMVYSKSRKVPIKYLRMQESGDFRNQADVAKTSRLADLLKGVVRVYTYTARRDLRFGGLSPNLVINGSNFKVNNSFKVTDEQGFNACPKGNPPSYDCAKCPSPCKSPRCHGIKGGGCFKCGLCKTNKGLVIRELLRSGGSAAQMGDAHPESVTPGAKGQGARKPKPVKKKKRGYPSGFGGILY